MPRPRTGSSSKRTTPVKRPAPPTRPAGKEPSSRRALVAAVGVAVVLVVAVYAFAVIRGEDTHSADGAGVEIEHVHGLGVDPDDGVLYAGTHYGLIRVPEQGQATRVADRVQDFMGFTVVGPDHYLASGHPGEGQDGPSSLGLIESTDGGETWESLSMAGQADFHSLEARHDNVYGLNSLTGELMVTQDKQNWETLTQIPMADFAVSPTDPDVLLSTTEQGLARSDDGGRTFQLVDNAPVMQLVSWAEDGTIVGVEPDGTVQASTDDGQSWQARGALEAAPHALTAASDDQIFAATEGAILSSEDGGRKFSVLHQD